MKATGGVAAVEIEFSRDVRVRIAPTAPIELATSIIKALVER